MSFSKRNTPNLILLPLIMISLLSSVFSFSGSNSISIGSSLASAQTGNVDIIRILSTSTYLDDLGNFHIIGEVNNTSTQPQNNIEITAVLSNTTNNVVVGNHSAFTSIGTLRTGELSPFDIVIQNPQQILGKFNFMEFITSSQPSIDGKPANLVLNGSSSFLDNSGNPHIMGSIINQGQNPEQFLNLVATFFDNSSLGVIGTQSFGLNVGNLPHNQIAPFDITITDNKTKSQGAFYSLNVDSNQSSMTSPFNTKTLFVSTAGTASSSGYSLNNGLPVNNPPVIANNNDDEPIARDDDDDDDDDNNSNNNDDSDDQRGEKKTDDQGNPWFDDKNCSEKPGSSGGSSSECEEAEREEESEGDDEDSSEKDQGPPSNSDSDSTNGDNYDDENENNNGDDNNGDENTGTTEDNSDESDEGNNDKN